MTPTIIWRAKCEHHDRRLPMGAGESTARDAPFFSACMHCDAEWQRWEVEEQRGWRVGVFADGRMTWAAWNLGLVSGEPGAIHATRAAAASDAQYLRIKYRSAEVVVRRVVRRTLRRVE